MGVLVSPKKVVITARELKDELLKRGATEVGIGNVKKGLTKDLLHMPIAISIGVMFSFLDKGKKNFIMGNLHESERLLEMLQMYVVKVLRANGFRCLAIPPNTHKEKEKFVSRLYMFFSHKVAATCAGLGWIGKNGLLVSKKYGPRLVWATVLTNAPLEVSGTPITNGKCGKCKKCVEACPSGAIPDREWVLEEGLVAHINVEACKRQLEKKLLYTGNKYCGLCIEVCPIGKEILRI